MPSSRRTPSPICNTSSGRKGGKGGKADIHCQGAALEVLAGGSKGQPPSGGSPAPPCPRPTALPPAGTQPAGSRAPLQMGQGDLGGQTSQLSDQRGLQELTTREGEGWAPVVSVPLARGSRKRPIQGTSAARETPPGPRPGSEALLGLGGRGHAAGPAARPWVSVCPRGQRCLPHLPARSRETSRGEGECSPCPTGCRAPPGGSADGEVRAVGHCVREDTRPGGRGLGGQGLESPRELESAVRGPRASHRQLQGSHPCVQGRVPSRLPGPRFKDAGGGLGGSGGTKEQLLGCSGSESGIRRLLPLSQPQPQSWRPQ